MKFAHLENFYSPSLLRLSTFFPLINMYVSDTMSIHLVSRMEKYCFRMETGKTKGKKMLFIQVFFKGNERIFRILDHLSLSPTLHTRKTLDLQSSKQETQKASA